MEQETEDEPKTFPESPVMEQEREAEPKHLSQLIGVQFNQMRAFYGRDMLVAIHALQ